jgi:hypothetical protein
MVRYGRDFLVNWELPLRHWFESLAPRQRLGRLLLSPERPLKPRSPIDRDGSRCVNSLFKLIAGKRPLEFRFPEAASRQCVLQTRFCPSVGFCQRHHRAPKRPFRRNLAHLSRRTIQIGRPVLTFVRSIEPAPLALTFSGDYIYLRRASRDGWALNAKN